MVHPGLQTFLVHFKPGQFYKENVSLFPPQQAIGVKKPLSLQICIIPTDL